MKYLHWLLLALALSAVVGLVRLVQDNVAMGSEDHLERARAMLASDENPDTEGARRELDRALELARGESDEELRRSLEASVLFERGLMYEKRGMLPSARADFGELAGWLEEIPKEARPTVAGGGTVDRVFLLLRLAALELSAKEFPAAETWANRALEIAPEHSWALTLAGRSFVQRADEAYAIVEEFIDAGLHEELSEVARGLALLAIHSPVSESERLARINEFLELFDEHHQDESAEVIEQLDLASEHMSAARRSFADSFLRSVSSPALYELTLSYLSAGQPEYVLDVGLAAINHEAASTNARALQVISQALLRLGRPEAAMAIVERAIPIDGQLQLEDNFLPTWAEILHANESWARLRRVGEQMARRFSKGVVYQPQRDAAAFYQGIAAYRMGLINAASDELQAYVRDDAFEPFPGAKAESRAAMAAIIGSGGNTTGERFHLRKSLLPELAQPETRTFDKLSTAWARLAELLELEEFDSLQVLDAYANALRFARAPNEEWLSHWRELGEEHLARIGRDPEVLASSLERQGRFVRAEAQDSFEDFRLAEVWWTRGQWDGVLDAARRFLKRYPHFGPAEGLMADVYRTTGRYPDLAELLLGRLRLGLANADTYRELRELAGQGRLDPDQVFELMAADAQVTGCLAMARQLMDRGRADLALRGLDAAPAEDIGSEGAVLAARAQVELGLYDLALQRVEPIPTDDPWFTQALDLRVEAALQSRDAAALERMLNQLVDVQDFELEAALGVVDRLLANRTVDTALALLRRLDELPAGRGPAVLSRLAVAELMAGDPDAASLALSRAEAYREDGFAELGRVLISVQQRSWSRLPSLVRDLREAEVRAAGEEGLAPFREALLAALEEHVSEAAGRALTGIESEPSEPLWSLLAAAVQRLRGAPIKVSPTLGREGRAQSAQFVGGTAEGPRDPREGLAVLATLGYPEWELWGRSRLLDRDSASAGPLWPGYLAARFEQRAGFTLTARNRLRPLVKRFDDCVPLWTKLEQVAYQLHGRLEHPEILSYRAGRAAAEGVADSDARVLDLLVQAETSEARGEVSQALEFAREAVLRDPQSELAHLRVAQLCAAEEWWSEAVANYADLFSLAEAELSQGYLPEFIEALNAGLETGQVEITSAALLLETLTAQLPNEPLLAARLAQLEFDRLPDNPLLAGARAVSGLGAFRERTEDVALEDLREGATESWLDIYLAYDRQLAGEFIQEELRKRPENLELWLMYGRTLEATARYSEAVDHYETVRLMVPEPRALRRAADILARLGTDHQRVVTYAQRIAAVDALNVEDPQLRLLLARSRVNGSPNNLGEGVAELKRLWAERDSLPAETADELPKLFLSALLRYGDPKDKDLAQAVGALALESAEGDLESEVLRAQLNLANLMWRLPDPLASEED